MPHAVDVTPFTQELFFFADVDDEEIVATDDIDRAKLVVAVRSEVRVRQNAIRFVHARSLAQCKHMVRFGIAILFGALVTSTNVARAPAQARCHVTVSIPQSCRSSSCRQVPRVADGECITQGYLEYTPPGYGDGTPRPLLITLHGRGENGNGNAASISRIVNHGVPELIHRNQWPAVASAREFVVLSPLHTASPGQTCHSAAEIAAFIDYAARAYDIDRSRMYLTGLSCGGIGIWNYLSEHATDSPIAAAVVISGDARGAWAAQGCALGRVPTWTFHGARDASIEHERVPVTALLACMPTPDASLTIYPTAGHDAWTRTYRGREHDVYAWLLQHHR